MVVSSVGMLSECKRGFVTSLRKRNSHLVVYRHIVPFNFDVEQNPLFIDGLQVLLSSPPTLGVPRFVIPLEQSLPPCRLSAGYGA